MTSPARAPRPTPRREVLAPRTRRDHLRVVPEPGRAAARPRTGTRLAFAIVVVFGSLLTAAVLHGMLASGQSHLNDLDSEIRAEKVAVAQERLALADLQDPGRIADEALRIGMVPADGQVWLSPGSGAEPVITGDVGSAADDEQDPDADPGPATDGGSSELAGPSPSGVSE